MIETNLAESVQVSFRIPLRDARVIAQGQDKLSLRNLTARSYTIRSFKWSPAPVGKSTAPWTISWIEDAEFASDGNLELTLRGNPGDTFALERSADLKTWELVQNVTFSTDTAVIADPSAKAQSNNNYRLRWINR